MKRILLIISILFLSACNAQEQASKDAQLSIEKGDFRLFQVPGRGTVLPGVATKQRTNAAKLCGVKIIEGISDVIQKDEDIEKRKQLTQYASQYNALVYTECLNANSSKVTH